MQIARNFYTLAARLIPKQTHIASKFALAKQHAFHVMGATMRERLLILANQSGKTAVCLS
ncbi:hypothetical protein [Xylella fastidiosa]|uniref:hypothetical protein n=1 Tax=Xylella fastidiosa TaxID=2371 RepID=UPI00041C31AE|nr:hypothetical protein [Xylella fastidiosa]KFA41997.1 hypothetical protein DF22_001440 [Xylella fastidiosa]MDC7970770.1 terminase [Xylella fastidiosa subsp. multiplex]MDD0909820.1 terminase [Xylella fastidiosa subsp. multiplex]MDD0927330.1 terminase [Xylella fastidiosa subsp. multiplex]MDD0929791.1 terminase [Xylella fastidiosa subsp. multiplex]